VPVGPQISYVPHVGTVFFSIEQSYHPLESFVKRRFPMPQSCTRMGLCKVSDVSSGKAIKIEKQGLTLAVFNVAGDYLVTDDACTHGPGSLSEGCIDGEVVECDFHNGAFNIRTGEVVAPPCMIPLKTYKTYVENDEVGIELVESE
jgi:nitrite reductase/ring-hydroxylating ferredoxin subunit